MKKRLLAGLAALVMAASTGCADSESSSESASSEQAAAESSSESESSGNAGNVKGLSMSVNSSDGKMSITRADDKSTPMGDPDTWTIFVYLCGTDLESRFGSATGDIKQMIGAQASDNVRFVVQTGGTKNWSNEYFGDEKAERWVVQNNNMERVESTDNTNMGSSDNLADFLKWGVSEYPAAKMGVILWDHGGGSINGACADELNEDDSLSLQEINTAFSDVYQDMTDKFEFIGFDCCLMGTAETANILASYARYFYGSQETEPGSGWDYATCGTYLAEHPGADGAELGKVVSDSFYDECGLIDREKDCTLSVIDLSKFDEFTVAFNDFSKELFDSAGSSLSGIVRGIGKADNFGGNNKSVGYTNMVDIGGIIKQCSSYADGTAALEALENCVIYNKNGSAHSGASGLSTYYPLKIDDSSDLKVFSGITISPYYLSIIDMIAKGYSEDGYSNSGIFDSEGSWEYGGSDEDSGYFDYADDLDTKSDLITFEQEPTLSDNGVYSFKLDENGLNNTAGASAYIYMMLDEETIVELGETYDVNTDWESGEVADNFDGLWLALPNGKLLAIYIAGGDSEHYVYTSPILLNGQRTNLRIVRDSEGISLEGIWDGIDENGMAAREVTKLKEGDKIAPIYYLINSDNDDINEETAEEYVWEEDSDLMYAYLPASNYFYGFNIEDAYGRTVTTNPVVFTIDDDGKITFSDPNDGADEADEADEDNEEDEEE